MAYWTDWTSIKVLSPTFYTFVSMLIKMLSLKATLNWNKGMPDSHRRYPWNLYLLRKQIVIFDSALRFGDCFVKNIICIALENKFTYALFRTIYCYIWRKESKTSLFRSEIYPTASRALRSAYCPNQNGSVTKTWFPLSNPAATYPKPSSHLFNITANKLKLKAK